MGVQQDLVDTTLAPPRWARSKRCRSRNFGSGCGIIFPAWPLTYTPAHWTLPTHTRPPYLIQPTAAQPKSKIEPGLPGGGFGVNLANWGLLGQTAQLLVGESEINPEAVGYCLLAILGAELSDRLPSSERLDRQNLNLFVLLVGPSGVSRKSSAMSRAASFWRAFCRQRDVDPDAHTPHIIEGVGSGEGLARLLSGGSEEEPTRACLLYDESAQFAAKAGLDGSSLSFIFNSLYDGRTWENQIKRSDHSTKVVNAVLSFIGAATPEIYESLWSEQGVSLGILNRFLLINVPPCAKAVFWPRFPTDAIKDEIGRTWQSRLRSSPFRVEWPETARLALQDWYNKLDRTKAESSRLDDLIKRIVILNCWCRAVHAVDQTALEAGIAVVGAQLLLRQGWWEQTNPMAVRIEDNLRKGDLTSRELYRKVSAHRAGSTFAMSLDTLEKSGLIIKRPFTSGSSVSWRWHLVQD